MPVIDADTHVRECDDTFSYMEESEREHIPAKGETPGKNGRPPRGYWMVNGQPMGRTILADGDYWKTMGELLDIDARVRAMDEMGVDVQVVYPSLLSKAVGSPEAELALTKTYNRWLAERCGRSGGRMRWVICPPLQSMDQALEELRWGKEHGAVGVLKKGDEEAGFWPAEEYFYPLYAEAERLGLSMCFHVGTGYAQPMPLERLAHFTHHKFHLSNVSAVHALITFQVPSMFPKLRWGFMELSASWVPYVLYYDRRILSKTAQRSSVASSVAGSTTYEVPVDVFSRNNIYVACFVDEDLPTIVRAMGEDNLITGSDFVHHDHAEELNYIGALNARARTGEISETLVRKIVADNPTRFYGL
jgi:predicted TIM-barrel fold metal-dependent hydrolase